ncbi:MAG: 2-oxoacid:acceptor oxidoreductase subunit alpha [Desulfobacteraceae bacterium]|nr:2-oxoacid:acceptor oxidoreductase subunit alpha [Desulfobacteraceae bacterium]
MGIDITVKIGGEAGQGIQTVGDILALVCHKAGLHIMAINDFESRIRGGHSFFQIRISDRFISAPYHKTHLLVALNQETYDLHRDEIASGGLVMTDKTDKTDKTDEKGINVLSIPINELAKQAGGEITSNTVAAGACLALLGAPFELLENLLKERFSTKSNDVVEKNLSAASLGYNAACDVAFKYSFTWKPGEPKGTVINGSKAVALGALAGDCRFASFYPMSPATGIMTCLTEFTDDFPLVVEQAEDEIAAINMIIGASFAGVRAITSTSGGGFCLMTEGLGLAAITETPVVIVNAQRPGPATGLPTRTAQGDLLFVINASQDEFPRFVFAPGTVNEAFETTARAFHLSEKYQVPVIILVDKFFNDSLYIAEKPFIAPRTAEKFYIDDHDIENPSEYKRYALTPSGVSPRALPCMGKSLVLVSGNEHREDGHISEKISDRVNMVNKRNAKMSHMIKEINPPESYYGESEILLVSWGSSKGAVKESVDILRGEGMSVGYLHFSDLWPFPSDPANKALAKAKTIIMVEQNSTAQLGRLIREQTGLSFSDAVLKYDGRSFYPFGIAEEVKKIVREYK